MRKKSAILSTVKLAHLPRLTFFSGTQVIFAHFHASFVLARPCPWIFLYITKSNAHANLNPEKHTDISFFDLSELLTLSVATFPNHPLQPLTQQWPQSPVRQTFSNVFLAECTASNISTLTTKFF